MRLSTKGRYAVMALVDLAGHSNGRPVALADISGRQEISLSYLEQLFAKLRRAGLVAARKEGSSVRYSLTSPQVTELLAVARLILTEVLSGQAGLLDDLRASPR